MRIVAMFPPEEQTVVRMRLAESLHAVVSQRLLPRANEQGRVVACEVMLVTSTIRDLIAEGTIAEIRDYIADGGQYGMRTFDQHLTELVNGNEVTFEVAKAAATNPADFELSFRMGRNRRTPNAQVTGIAPRLTGSAKSVTQGLGTIATPSGLGANPLGTGPTMPPIATSPSGHSAVTSPNPLGNDAVFGSGFESLFGS
jgi:twitching motility protein PilT